MVGYKAFSVKGKIVIKNKAGSRGAFTVFTLLGKTNFNKLLAKCLRSLAMVNIRT